jgi:2-polyprenyl-3-methyl-5-hydroxy-6-metoxy-1,4-benzoquinol methylase
MINDIYNFYNSNYIGEVSKGGYYDEKKLFYLENLEKIKNNKKNLKILDIACNDGQLALAFKKYGDVMGIDINKDAVKRSIKNGIKCIHTDVYGLGKKYYSYFDVVIAGDIIEHVFNTDNFLYEIDKLLNVRGVLLLTTANIASLGRRMMLLFGQNPYTEYSTMLPNKEYNVGHIRYYTAKNIKDQLEMVGFQEVEVFGDKINITSNIAIPRFISKHLPSLSRYLHVVAKK